MSYNCAVIIPAIEFDFDVSKCIDGCNSQNIVKVKIYLLTDKKIKKKIKSKNIKIIHTGDITMSEKRNIGVKMCKEKYVAFIDSDAYPKRDWLYNGIKILKKNKKIGMVSGPDIPFPDQKGLSYFIGLAHKSFFLSGSKVFRKRSVKKSIVNQASSCNMIMEKKLFQKVCGMDKKIYIGEDKDFCDRLNKVTKIMHSPDVLIYHRVRAFVPFLLQRFVYGTCVFDIIKLNKKIKFNDIQYFIPLLITLFYLLFPFFYNLKILFQISLFAITILNLIILVEAVRISLNPLKIILIFTIIKLNIIAFGLGSISKALGFKKSIKKIYTKR